MCDKCKNLLNLPNDKKAWIHLLNYKEDELNQVEMEYYIEIFCIIIIHLFYGMNHMWH